MGGCFLRQQGGVDAANDDGRTLRAEMVGKPVAFDGRSRDDADGHKVKGSVHRHIGDARVADADVEAEFRRRQRGKERGGERRLAEGYAKEWQRKPMYPAVWQENQHSKTPLFAFVRSFHSRREPSFFKRLILYQKYVPIRAPGHSSPNGKAMKSLSSFRTSRQRGIHWSIFRSKSIE